MIHELVTSYARHGRRSGLKQGLGIHELGASWPPNTESGVVQE